MDSGKSLALNGAASEGDGMKFCFAAFAAVSALISVLASGCASLTLSQVQRLTVLTYNIHHGEGVDGKLDLERIARLISRENPDLVALQEVDQNTQRTGGVDQAKELARLTGMHFAFGSAMDYQGGDYGQAILSRWPIQHHSVHILPQRDGREPRICLAVQLKSPVPDLTFASTHLDHQVEAIRIQQAQELNKIFAERNPAILAGDFNAVLSSETMQSLLAEWSDSAGTNSAPTIPAAKPARRIDYILTRPESRWRMITSRVVDEPVASDHLPVLAVLELKTK